MSQYGLGVVLLQEGRPVAYASRSLTQTEQNYAQIEKELYAIVFACEKFHQYIYGKRVHVQSNHKPLESILKKPLVVAPARLQRMMLRLQKYDVHIAYKPGKEIPVADALSRKPLAQRSDDTILQGWPAEREQCSQLVQPYWNIRDELSTMNGLIFKGDRIVIPSVLHSEMLCLIHQGHLCIEKCRQRARQVLFWPNMNKDIENLLRHLSET